jgi:hypothetical protein
MFVLPFLLCFHVDMFSLVGSFGAFFRRLVRSLLRLAVGAFRFDYRFGSQFDLVVRASLAMLLELVFLFLQRPRKLLPLVRIRVLRLHHSIRRHVLDSVDTVRSLHRLTSGAR